MAGNIITAENHFQTKSVNAYPNFLEKQIQARGPLFKKNNDAQNGNFNLALSVSYGVLKSCPEPDYLNWDHQQKCQPTPAITVDIFKFLTTANFSKIFHTIGSDIDKAVMTQSQIVRFCTLYPRQVSVRGNKSIFLTEMNGELFPVEIFWTNSGLMALIDKFDCETIWSPKNEIRIVCPTGAVTKFV